MNTNKKADQHKEEAREEKQTAKNNCCYASPDVDMYETDHEYTILYELPGVKKEDVKVTVEKDILTITAGQDESQDRENECLRAEMDFTGYKRSFYLNSLVDVDTIKADYQNGVLTLTLPKPEERKPKEIAISAG